MTFKKGLEISPFKSKKISNRELKYQIEPNREFCVSLHTYRGNIN